MDFLGDNDGVYIEVPSAAEDAFESIVDNDAATIGLWMFGGEFQPQNNFAFWFADGDADPRQLGAHVPWSNGNIFFDVAGCCGATQRITTALDPDLYQDTWTHYTFVKDGESTAIYINGELFLDSGGNIMDPLGPITTVRFGSGQAPGQWSYNGLMDDIAVWDEALSEEDIVKLFEGTLLGGGPMAAPGDFDKDGDLDVDDVDALSREIAAGTNNATFDVTDDAVVNGDDLKTWVKQLRKTWIGDSDLNGVFNTGDLIRVFQAGKFEMATEASWGQGDWTADLRFNTSDLIAAFQDGGFEKGPVQGVAAVPEPSALVLVALGVAVWAMRRRPSTA